MTEKIKKPVKRAQGKYQGPSKRLPLKKKPTKAQKKLWAPLVDQLTRLILACEPHPVNMSVGHKKSHIKITWKTPVPKWFPISKEGRGEEKLYIADTVLKALYANWLADVTPEMIYSSRYQYLRQLASLDKFLECNDMLGDV